MTKVRDFVAGLARAGKSCKEIKNLTDAAYGVKTLTKTAIYNILNKVKAGKTTDDQRHLNAKKTKTTIDVVAAVAAEVNEDRRVTIRHLATVHGVSYGSMHNILHKSLGLVKKSARWVPKLLSDDQKQERVRVCTEFVAAVNRRSLSMLDNIVTMDETMVSYHTPETKKQSKQWIKKGQPGPIKARVHASRTKQMLLVFFDSKGLIYTHIVPRGAAINAKYILMVLGKFLEHLRRKRPEMVTRDWFFHWDNASVHTAAVVKSWLTAKAFKVLEHPPYSPDLAPADFFLFRRVKEELSGLTLSQESLKKTWEGVIRTIADEEFAVAFRRWYERCQKCIRIGGGYVEKS
jgi:[histone H3]-lysine36 N-dimethyltransferase SETMAR